MYQFSYRVFWIEDDQILETSVPTKKDMEILKEGLKREGLHPYITCDTTENFFVGGSHKVKWGDISNRKRKGKAQSASPE